MGVHARIWFTPQQRAELWERWKNGQCVADIADQLSRNNFQPAQVDMVLTRMNRIHSSHPTLA